MGEPTLLPCPFCGSAAKYEGWTGADEAGMPATGCSVWCGNVLCPISPEVASSTDVAVDKWNARAPDPLTATLAARAERVSELERANEALRGLADARVTIIATLERELAEARQRDEDATDLILRQGRELDAMRPKAEAAERRAEALRVIGDVHQIGVLMGEADRAILAACPAEEPRQVVEPAPAPARYRCEGCGWEGSDAWDHQGAMVHGYGGEDVCGPVVPVLDAQPAGAAP